jgi:hypothetical protein
MQQAPTKPRPSRILTFWDKRVAENLDNLVIYQLNIIETNFILG